MNDDGSAATILAEAVSPRQLQGRLRFTVIGETLLELMAAAEAKASELMGEVPFEVEFVDVHQEGTAMRIDGFTANVLLRYDVVRVGGWTT